MRNETFDQSQISSRGLRLHRRIHRTEKSRQIESTQSQASDDTETATTTALQRPKKFRVVTGVHDPDPAIGSDDLGFEKICGRRAVAFRPGAETTATDEPCHTHAQAIAALHIPASLGRHLVVGLTPDATGITAYRWLWRDFPSASLWDERIVHNQLPHPVCPDKQRVGCIRRALIAVSRPLHHQAQSVFARKIYSCDDIGCALRSHGVDTGP